MNALEHPIEGLMKTAMESIREMVDVNTVVGDAVEAPDGTIVIPISRVAVGFAAGGGEFEAGGAEEKAGFPFGGGSGAGVSVQPVGFLVVGKDQIRLLPVETNFAVDRLIDLAPQIIEKLDSYLQNRARH
ncbi:MAG: GerW family sporulation protein [Desulfotomaculales bacterium]